ncbi:unnamed protein product, partial [Closterium sp. NIES-53]
TSGMGLVLGGQARVVLTGHADASWVLLLPLPTLLCFYALTLLCHHSTFSFRAAEETHVHRLGSFSAWVSRTPRHNPLLCLPVTRSQLHLRTSP